jgi:hypothetical protein
MVDDATEGFSPCPRQIVDLVATCVTPSPLGGTLFDNCAGKGEAAATLAANWSLRPVLVEPHSGRHAACLRYDKYALCAPSQNVRANGPTVWFFNPPFDPADQTGSMEKHLFWHGVRHFPGPGTLCVWLLPERILKDSRVREEISIRLEALTIAKFPQPWFDEFGEVAILGYWKGFPRFGRWVPSESTNLPALSPPRSPYVLRAVGKTFTAQIQAARCLVL